MYEKIRRVGDEFENLPSRESMSRHRKFYGNNLGDRLHPLSQFLNARVGRPWSHVYAEICAANDRRTIRGYHLLTHVASYVHASPYNVGTRCYGEFFVDWDGTLQKEKRRPFRYRKPKEGNPKIVDTENHWYEKIPSKRGGFWYEFTVSHFRQPNSREDLAMVDGEVQIIRIPLPDAEWTKTLKRQVDAMETKRLEAMRIASRNPVAKI